MIDVDKKVQEITNSPIGCQFLLDIEASALSPEEAAIPTNCLWLAAGSVGAIEWWRSDHDEVVADALEHGERLQALARTILEHPATAWWFDPVDLDNQVWISHDKVLPDTANWQRPKSPPDRWERYAQKPRSGPYQYTSTLNGGDTSLFVALDEGVGDLNLWSLPLQCWKLQVCPAVQVYEIHGPEDWNQLCIRYSAEGTKDGPPDQNWLVPDWGAAAEDWDGVHLSLGGLLTTENVRYESEGGVSMLLFAGAELAYWLRGFSSNAQRLSDRDRNKERPDLKRGDPNPRRRRGVPLRRVDQ